MKQGKVRRDLLIAFASQLAFKILGFVVLAVMARLLSQAEYGKLMFALTLCGVPVKPWTSRTPVSDPSWE